MRHIVNIVADPSFTEPNDKQSKNNDERQPKKKWRERRTSVKRKQLKTQNKNTDNDTWALRSSLHFYRFNLIIDLDNILRLRIFEQILLSFCIIARF